MLNVFGLYLIRMFYRFTMTKHHRMFCWPSTSSVILITCSYWIADVSTGRREFLALLHGSSWGGKVVPLFCQNYFGQQSLSLHCVKRWPSFYQKWKRRDAMPIQTSAEIATTPLPVIRPEQWQQVKRVSLRDHLHLRCFRHDCECTPFRGRAPAVYFRSYQLFTRLGKSWAARNVEF